MTHKILLVDDSQVVLRFHSSILTAKGYEVDTATNGYVALETLTQKTFDLIVSDVNMPKMGGFEFTRRVRSQPGFKSTPIIMVSTECEEADLVAGLAAGANVYLFKPVKPENLLQQVGMLLGVKAS